MTHHVTISLDDQELDRARATAESLGVTLEEYIRRLVCGEPAARANVGAPDWSLIIGIGESSEPTDVARDKDNMIGEAVWREYLEETGQK